MVQMNDQEYKKWKEFQEKHKEAEGHYYKCFPGGGIGTKIVAVAVYRFGLWSKEEEEDITDYECW